MSLAETIIPQLTYLPVSLSSLSYYLACPYKSKRWLSLPLRYCSIVSFDSILAARSSATFSLTPIMFTAKDTNWMPKNPNFWLPSRLLFDSFSNSVPYPSTTSSSSNLTMLNFLRVNFVFSLPQSLFMW